MAELLERYLPTEVPYRVTDIDFKQWSDEGVKAVFFDIEATLGETGNAELIPAYVDAVQAARQAGIEHVLLITNRAVKESTKNKDLALLEGWRQQIGADEILAPRHASQRKPSPYMIHEGLALVNAAREAKGLDSITPKEAGLVDDKRTAGVKAARYAGLEHIAWTRSFGRLQTGDRLIRKPYEDLWRVIVHMHIDPVWDETMGDDERRITRSRALLKLAAKQVAEGDEPANKVIGYGVEAPELPQELLDSMQAPIHYRVLRSLQEFGEKYGEWPAEKLREFLYEHGRTTADLLTYSRIALAIGNALVEDSNLDEETKLRMHTALVILKDVTDFLDGKAARAHRDGPTAKGAANDQNIDKVVDAIVEVAVCIPRGAMGKLDFWAIVARDTGMTAFRAPFKKRGMKTSSVSSGRFATALRGVWHVAAAKTGSRHAERMRQIGHVVAIAKIVSMLHGPLAWIEEYERSIHEANNLERWLGRQALSREQEDEAASYGIM